MFESAKCIFLQERIVFNTLIALITEDFRQKNIHIGDEIIKVFKGKGVRE